MASMIERIASLQDFDQYRDLHWEGSFEDYLEIVRARPEVTRNAFQRVYDMIIAAGVEEYVDNKKKLLKYNFFRDDSGLGRDAVFGLDIPLMRLVNVLKAAAEGYGPERRVILLHGPVGVEEHHRAAPQEGHGGVLPHPRGRALHVHLDQPRRHRTSSPAKTTTTFPSPMNEEPLLLIPPEWREKAIQARPRQRPHQGTRPRATSTPRVGTSSNT
jgi:serine protein kinase